MPVPSFLFNDYTVCGADCLIITFVLSVTPCFWNLHIPAIEPPLGLCCKLWPFHVSYIYQVFSLIVQRVTGKKRGTMHFLRKT